MEDFHTLLRLFRRRNELGLKTCFGKALPWFTNFDPGSERARHHKRKVARQSRVMEAWAKDIFPELDFDQSMQMLFAGHYVIP